MPSNPKSRYVLLIENLSSSTRSRDIRAECERHGKVVKVERDLRERCAVVDYAHSGDAADAYDALDRVVVDGREWEVHWARAKDLKWFGWPTEEFDEEPASSGRPSPVQETRRE